ncbi:unnamed protein product [Ixodes persulcatus]
MRTEQLAASPDSEALMFGVRRSPKHRAREGKRYFAGRRRETRWRYDERWRRSTEWPMRVHRRGPIARRWRFPPKSATAWRLRTGQGADGSAGRPGAADADPAVPSGVEPTWPPTAAAPRPGANGGGKRRVLDADR